LRLLIPGASVFLLHENQEPNLDLLKFFPQLQKYFRLEPLSSEGHGDNTATILDPTFYAMDFLSAFQSSTITLTPPANNASPHYERKLRTYNREVKVNEIWNQGGFDGFISVSSYDLPTYLPRCLEHVETSAGIAIYGPFREVSLPKPS
jgi:hypothetical protein